MQLKVNHIKREEIINELVCYSEKIFGSKRRAGFYVVVCHYIVVSSIVGAIIFSNNPTIFRIAVTCWILIIFLHNIFDGCFLIRLERALFESKNWYGIWHLILIPLEMIGYPTTRSLLDLVLVWLGVIITSIVLLRVM
jgi:hypothetical protein